MNRILVTAALLAGCSSSTTAGSIDDFDRQVAQLSCDFLFRCCTPVPAHVGADSASCQNMAAAVAQKNNTIDAAIAAGFAKFDAAAAAACLDAYRTLYSSCDQPASIDPGACSNLVYGTLPIGAACMSDLSGARCGAGLYCSAPTGNTGVCAAQPAVGGDCSSAKCTAGVVCLPNKRCGTPLASGQACTGNDQCQTNNCANSVCSAPRLLRDLVCK
jgi:hypothetical protein